MVQTHVGGAWRLARLAGFRRGDEHFLSGQIQVDAIRSIRHFGAYNLSTQFVVVLLSGFFGIGGAKVNVFPGESHHVGFP